MFFSSVLASGFCFAYGNAVFVASKVKEKAPVVNALGAEWSSDWSQMSTNVAALRRVREALNTLAKMPTSIPQ